MHDVSIAIFLCCWLMQLAFGIIHCIQALTASGARSQYILTMDISLFISIIPDTDWFQIAFAQVCGSDYSGVLHLLQQCTDEDQS